MRFDAYAATTAAVPADVLGNILARFPSAWTDLAQPKYGYTHAQKLSYAGDTALLMHRNQEGVPETHVSVQGLWSPALASAIRIDHPDHSVSRADVCIDLDQPGFFDWLTPIAIDLATAAGLKLSQAGNWLTPQGIAEGRTLYIGAPSSAYRIRIYEKGKKHINEGTDPDASPDWTRLEVQIRPAKDFKRSAATMEPSELFATCKLATKLLTLITGHEVPHLAQIHHRRPATDASVKFQHLTHAYGRFVLMLIETVEPAELARLLRQQLAAPNRPDVLQARHVPHDESAAPDSL